MKASHRQAIRLALAFVVTAFVWGLGSASDTVIDGRGFAFCTQSCSGFRAVCHDRCKASCFVPGLDPEAQETCFMTCDAVCVAESLYCKKYCLDLFQDGAQQEP